MGNTPRDWKRPVIVLAALGALTVAALAAPASAHLGSFGHLKGHIKKIAKKEAKKLLKADSTLNMFIEESELVRFGPISLSATSADQTIGTFGPFTLKAHCDEDPAGTLLGQILISTSTDHSALNTDESNIDDFTPADGDEVWAEHTDDFPDDGTQEFIDDEDSDAVSMSPNGAAALSSTGNLILLNGQGAGAPDCLFAGALLLVTEA